MSLSKKIKDLREMNNISQSDLADKVHVHRSTVAHWELGSRKPDYEMIKTLSEVFGVSTDFLIGVTEVPDGKIINAESIKFMTHSVPVYGRIPAGTPFEAIQERLEDIEVPNRFKKKKGLFGLKIVGDSMNRVIPDGAIAIFQQTCELNQGDIGAIMVNGDDATVKHFYKLRDACVLEPDSFNDNHKPIVIDGKNGPEVRIIGKFIWYCMDPDDEPK